MNTVNFQRTVSDASSFWLPALTSPADLVLATYFFAFQLYCDFSGYSDLAIGAAKVLGFDLMTNFRRPYLSASVREFWAERRHLSLAAWFRDYLYIPLGGSRVSRLRRYLNVMIVFLVSGLWHGANWTFVVWGGLHGFYLALERMFGIGKERAAWAGAGAIEWVRRIVSIVVTFHLVTLAWIFFRSPNIAAAFDYLRGIARFEDLAAVGPIPFVAAAAVLALDIPQYVTGRHTALMRLPFQFARWITGPTEDLRRVTWAPGARATEDADGHLVGLFDGQWALDYTREKNPTLQFHDIAPIGDAVAAGV